MSEILQLWKSHCDMISNKNLTILGKTKRGLGENNNITDKQLRFHNNKDRIITISEMFSIQIDIFNSDDRSSVWTFEELKDLCNGFVKALNELIGEEMCRGHIKFNPK